jgi:hypothetical protein
MSSILPKFEQQEFKKNKKQKNEQPWTLVYIFVLQTMSSPLNSLFWSTPISFPPK